MKLQGFLIGLTVVALGFLCFTSCKKNTDCVAVVICNDSTGTGIGGAKVFLYANVKTPNSGTITADLRATGYTDETGRVSFTFKLPAIYDISASVTKSAVTYSALSIIKLEEGKTVDNTVTLR